MRFRPGARLDTGQVTDARGSGVGTGGLAVGGGGIGLVALVVYLAYALLSGSGSGGLGQLEPLDNTQVGQGSTPSAIAQECRTGADANQREDCRIVGVVNSVQKFWTGVFQRSGKQYRDVNTVFFTGGVQTGCGSATSEVGPFYCPQDQRVYIDLGFFDELQSRFGTSAGPFVQAYVIAHEYGHHVQDQLGVLAGDPRVAAGAGEQGRPLRAPGGLLRGGVGGQRRPDGNHRADHRSRTSTRASTPRPRSETTASSSRRRARSTPRRGRTARRNSAAAGSRAATSRASRRPATPSQVPSRRGGRPPRKPGALSCVHSRNQASR